MMRDAFEFDAFWLMKMGFIFIYKMNFIFSKTFLKNVLIFVLKFVLKTKRKNLNS